MTRNEGRDKEGVALICHRDGTIQEVVRNDPGLDEAFLLHRPFPACLEVEALQEGLDFLLAIRRQQVACGWVLPLHGLPPGSTLQFSGGIVDERILIIGTPLPQAVDPGPGRPGTAGQVTAPGDPFLEDLSRLNNELTNAQRELVRKNAALDKAHQRINTLLGVAAHDLRNPISVIRTYADILLEAPPGVPDPDAHECLVQIRRVSDYMVGLLQNLLDLSAIQSGLLRLEPRSLNPVDFLSHTLPPDRLLASQREVTILTDFPESFPDLPFDPLKIQQVIHNLVGNAIKFSPRGGVVRIALEQHDHMAVVRVSDQGPGIPLTEQKLLFRPFSRTSVTPAGGEKGSGLGLAICKKIIEGHQGRIWVESTPHQGTTFSFTLPMAPGPAAMPSDPSS